MIRIIYYGRSMHLEYKDFEDLESARKFYTYAKFCHNEVQGWDGWMGSVHSVSEIKDIKLEIDTVEYERLKQERKDREADMERRKYEEEMKEKEETYEQLKRELGKE